MLKINNFIATEVHGFNNYHLNFNSDVTFLVGINGSGKTTVLRLMQAMLSLDFSVLFSIKFKRLFCKLTIRNQEHVIEIRTRGEKILLIIDGSSENQEVSILQAPDREAVYAKSPRFDDYIEDIRLRFINESSERVKEMLRWPRPLFLGLERRTERYENENYYEMEVEKHVFRSRKFSREITEGIENCQSLLERTYRTYRKHSDNLNNKLITTIVDSAFDYIEFEPNWLPMERSGYRMYQDVISRRGEIENFVLRIGDGRSRAAEKIRNFYEKITRIFDEEKNTGQSLSIELIMNIAQLQRIQAVLTEMDSQKKIAERRYAPIADFLNTLNIFLKDSKKIASVDALGRLVISQNGQSINLQYLSSGEKQLIILLAHARFARTRGGVVIVDEPEVSLHLRWQEMLIEGLSLDDTETQFIFATHSPEIVGYKKDKAILVG